MAVPTNADLVIIVAFISTFLFGAYIAVVFRCFLTLYSRYKAKQTQLYRDLIVTQSALFILIFLRFIFVLSRATFSVVNRAPDGTVDLGKLDSSINSPFNIPWMLCIVFADMFVAYYAFIMTLKRPGLLISALPAFAFANTCVVIWLGYLITEDSAIFISPPTAAAKIFCFLTAITNIWCSGLVLWHIISVQRREIMTSEESLLRGVTMLLVAIWTATVSLAIILNTFVPVGSYLNFILKDMCPPYVGIILSQIIVTIAGGQSYSDGTRRSAWAGRF